MLKGFYVLGVARTVQLLDYGLDDPGFGSF